MRNKEAVQSFGGLHFLGLWTWMYSNSNPRPRPPRPISTVVGCRKPHHGAYSSKNSACPVAASKNAKSPYLCISSEPCIIQLNLSLSTLSSYYYSAKPSSHKPFPTTRSFEGFVRIVKRTKGWLSERQQLHA